MRAYLVGMSAVVMLMFGGCFPNQVTPVIPVRAGRAPRTETRVRAPMTNGHGIAVCDPVSSAGANADFARGCGRWLEMTVAGNGSLGQSPSWGETIVGAKDCKLTDLALRPKDMPVYLGTTGSDLAALGSFKATGSKYTLTYRLYSDAVHGLVGKTFSVSGSEGDIVKRLPLLAQNILTAAGVSHAQLPAPVHAGAGELAQIGALSKYEFGDPAPLPLQAKVLSLAHTVPLAALTCIHCAVTCHDDVKELAAHTAIIAMAPQNTLLLDAISYTNVLPSTLLPAIDAALLRYPNNYLARDAKFELIRQYTEGKTRIPQELNPAEEQKYKDAAVALTQCAPNNPFGYSKTRSALSDIADHIRKLRTVDAINDQEMQKLSGLYKQCAIADRMSLRLNPRHTHSWANLAVDCTFLGDQQNAEDAVETAIRLDNTFQPAYSWLVQMYMAKWFNSPYRLARTVPRVMNAPFSDSDKVIAGANLIEAQNPAGASYLFATVWAHIQLKLAKNATDFDALYLQSRMAHAAGHDEAAIPVLRRMVSVYPNVGTIHKDLGDYLHATARDQDAAVEYAEARRLDLGTYDVFRKALSE